MHGIQTVQLRLRLISSVPTALVVGIAVMFMVASIVAVIAYLRARAFKKRLQDALYFDKRTQTKRIDALVDGFHNTILSFDRDVSMYYINIDNFKNYNDLFGPSLGNMLLEQVASRMKALIEPYDTVYRVHSDQFIILHPTEADQFGQMTKKLLRTLKQPYTVGVHTIQITVSGGRYDITEKNPHFNDALLRSELAHNEAKATGKDRIIRYNEAIKKKNDRAFETYNLIKEALKEKWFFLEFQPVIDAKSRHITALECLIRVEKNRTVIFPQDIVMYAERFHLIEAIDRYVIEASFKAFKSFEASGKTLDFMSINISSKEIGNHRFIEYLVEQAKAYDVQPKKISLEFTETYFPDNLDEETSFLNSLREHGFKIAIDDFGTGYSSMSRLSKHRLDFLKIDRNFIIDIATNPNNQKIIDAMLYLASTFDIAIIAEGVETEADVEYLSKKDIAYYQGHYYHRALSKEQLFKIFKEEKA